MDFLIITLLSVIAAETSYLALVNFKKISNFRSADKKIFVDTSVLIDGRIVLVASSGFVMGKLCIPRSVLGELQFMADKADGEKRTRARYGLDVVAELQRIDGLKIEIFQDSILAKEGVDERLIYLAKKYKGSICTIDYNLNKVASVEGIKVLNVNDLAISLRMSYLPGEKTMLELTHKGSDDHQAVGHLLDGTMVVVERANNMIGKTVEVEFTRVLQTSAGKMMFAKVIKPAINNQQRYVQKSVIQKNANNNKSNNNVFKNNRNNYRKKPTQFTNKTNQTSEDIIVDLANK